MPQNAYHKSKHNDRSLILIRSVSAVHVLLRSVSAEHALLWCFERYWIGVSGVDGNIINWLAHWIKDQWG